MCFHCPLVAQKYQLLQVEGCAAVSRPRVVKHAWCICLNKRVFNQIITKM